VRLRCRLQLLDHVKQAVAGKIGHAGQGLEPGGDSVKRFVGVVVGQFAKDFPQFTRICQRMIDFFLGEKAAQTSYLVEH
jgi:hypothetical protein